jgi:hypothetical protein
MRPIAIFLAAMIATVGGCVSRDHRASPNDALQSPHEFRLVLARLYGAPGDLVTASLTFQNPGRVPLWIPKSDQLNFSYVSYDGEEVIALPASQCNGIEYVKVPRGQQVTYEKTFVVPHVRPGRIDVYVLQESHVRVSFEVR